MSTKDLTLNEIMETLRQQSKEDIIQFFGELIGEYEMNYGVAISSTSYAVSRVFKRLEIEVKQDA